MNLQIGADRLKYTFLYLLTLGYTLSFVQIKIMYQAVPHKDEEESNELERHEEEKRNMNDAVVVRAGQRYG